MLLKRHSAAPENVVERVGMLGRPGGLSSDQLDADRVRDPAGDLVLQNKQIADVTVEPFCPQMRVGLGIRSAGR